MKVTDIIRESQHQRDFILKGQMSAYDDVMCHEGTAQTLAQQDQPSMQYLPGGGGVYASSASLLVWENDIKMMLTVLQELALKRVRAGFTSIHLIPLLLHYL